MANYLAARLDQIDPQACPCGHTRRAFTQDPERRASLHLLEVSEDARLHYHRTITEVYFFLAGEGYMELDGERLPVGPLSAVLIKPGCRHRAVGRFTVAITAIPAFDPADEWFDE
jgi:mannose-6-phosphate isomerase-like protein (cupin superfamily)